MTFAAREDSRIAGHPIHLYEFRFGPEVDSVRRYTNIAKGFAWGGHTFEPLTIQHGEIVASGNLDKSTLQVRMPDEGDIPDLYTGSPPSSVVSLIIRQGHLADDDFKVCWSGRVGGTSYEGAELILDCEPISASLRRSGLTRLYTIPCPLVLYGPKCRANKAAASSNHIATTVNGPILTFASDWAPTDRKDKYIGGVVEWTNAAGRLERRSIVGRDGSTKLIMSNYSDTLVSGMTVTLVLGCNHQHGMNDTDGDCLNLHDNILNFGGQPEIPLKNPIGIVNNYV